MPSKECFIQEVAALLRVEKLLIGGEEVGWQPGRDDEELQIKLPLEVEGVQYGGQLMLTAFPNESGKFSISLVHGVAVVRLDVVSPYDGHRNPYDALGRRVPTMVYGPHLHSWGLNSRFVDADGKLERLPMAEPYSDSVKLMAALRWFGGKMKIEIPHGVQLELPNKERLL